jgi:hypothetical protein
MFSSTSKTSRITALTTPAPEDPKEVFAVMNLNVTFSQTADFGMPMTGTALVASVRALPSTGVRGAATAGSKRDFVDATPVCGYRAITDVAVFKGAFPGTSVWSPPI